MPHIVLECSDNIIEKDFKSLLLSIHHTLSENLPTDLSNCKSRVVRCEDVVMGNGDKNQAFVHVTISVLKGRSAELLKKISTMILEQVANALQTSAKQYVLQLSIAILELPDNFEKRTLTPE